VADEADWWPASLKPRLSSRSAQEVYLDRLERDPDYADTLRDAATDICNRVALGALAPRWPVDPGLDVAALRAELNAARRELGQVQAALAAVQWDNMAIRNSHGWRLLAPFRSVIDHIRRARR
jgi:hypothetical protein